MAIGSYQILYGATTMMGVIMVALNIAWISKYMGGFGNSLELKFNWHPFLMVLGMVFLYSQSILVYRTGGHNIPKKTMKIMHGIIHLVAFVVSVIGLQAVFDNHRKTHRSHLQSLHSWVGLVTIIIFAIQFCCGFITFLLPVIPVPVRKMVLPIHVHCGVIVFIMAIITTVAGICEIGTWNYYYALKKLPTAGMVLNFMGFFAVLYGCFTIYLLLEPKFKRTPLPED